MAYLMHYGAKGQRKGVRKYQNPDGSLTAAGKERYGDWEAKKIAWKINVRKWNKEQGNKKYSWDQKVAAYRMNQIDENFAQKGKNILEMKPELYEHKIEIKKAG